MLFDKLRNSENAEIAWVAKRFASKTAGDLHNVNPVRDRKLRRLIDLHSKTIAPVAQDLTDILLTDLSCMATINAAVPGFFAAMSQFRPALKAIKVKGEILFTPWPAARSLYLHADLDEVRPFIEKMSTPAEGIPAGTFEDYRFIDNPLPMVLDNITFTEEEVSELSEDPVIAKVLEESRSVSFGYNLLGHRVFATEEEQTVITLARATGGPAILTLSDAMDHLLAPVEVPETIVVASAMTFRREDLRTGNSRVKHSFIAWEPERIFETAIGLSANADDNRIWQGDDMEYLEAARDILHPLIEASVVAMMVPTYFDYQLEQVLSGDEAEKHIRISGRNEEAAKKKSSAGKGRSRKPYRLVRAVVTPKPKPGNGLTEALDGGWKRDKTMRSEPETQVEVKGFWRTLRPTSIGKTAQGLPVVGKTWVKEHRRWTDKAEPEALPRLKEPLGPYLSSSGEA